MAWRWRWALVAMVVLVTAASCGTTTSSTDPADGVTEPAADPDPSTDEAAAAGEDGEAGAEETEEPSPAPSTPESEAGQAATEEATPPRFDPLPIPADLDQVEDVFASLLGPTDDFVAQMRRVAPDYRQLPTPPGADIVAVRIGYSPGTEGATARQYITRVRMTSTEAPDVLGDLLERQLLDENPGWRLAAPAGITPQAARVLEFDLPDVVQQLDDQNVTPDLQITIDRAAPGSEVTIRTTEAGPEGPTPDAYSGWQDQLPIPEGTVQTLGSIAIDTEPAELVVSAAHVVTTAGLADYRDDYLALLTDRGLTVEAESPTREGTEFVVSGHPRFESITIAACCTENRFITEATNLRLTATIAR